MRRILQHIAGMDLGVLSQGLDGWTDLRTVARGFGYVEKVKELAATDDLLAGVVDGTTRYFTNVRIAENGELEARGRFDSQGMADGEVARGDTFDDCRGMG